MLRSLTLPSSLGWLVSPTVSDYEGAGRPKDEVGIGSAIRSVNVGGTTLIEPGVDVASTNASNIAAALDAVQKADVTVLVLGITKGQEHEVGTYLQSDTSISSFFFWSSYGLCLISPCLVFLLPPPLLRIRDPKCSRSIVLTGTVVSADFRAWIEHRLYSQDCKRALLTRCSPQRPLVARRSSWSPYLVGLFPSTL